MQRKATVVITPLGSTLGYSNVTYVFDGLERNAKTPLAIILESLVNQHSHDSRHICDEYIYSFILVPDTFLFSESEGTKEWYFKNKTDIKTTYSQFIEEQILSSSQSRINLADNSREKSSGKKIPECVRNRIIVVPNNGAYGPPRFRRTVFQGLLNDTYSVALIRIVLEILKENISLIKHVIVNISQSINHLGYVSIRVGYDLTEIGSIQSFLSEDGARRFAPSITILNSDPVIKRSITPSTKFEIHEILHEELSGIKTPTFQTITRLFLKHKKK